MKERFRKIGKHLLEKQYYYVCGIITIVILAMGFFRFPNALGRLIESVRDFGVSIAGLFCEVFDIDYDFTITVNTLPDYDFLNVKKWGFGLFGKTPANSYTPSLPFPETWEEFKAAWVKYWRAWADLYNFLMYVYHTLNVLWALWIISVVVVPLCFLIRALFMKFYFREKPRPKNEGDSPPPDVDEPEITDSKPLQLWHRFYFNVVLRVVAWFVRLYYFIKERDTLWGFWLLCALLYFNVLTIAVEFISYYVYLVYTIDFTTLYLQVYKLCLDLWAFCSFMPFIGWVILIIVLLEVWSRRIGYDNLYHQERCNRGLCNELGVVTYIYAEMGGFKTTMMTDMLMSDEVQLRDDALEIILECDACFPNFPWLRLERVLKQAYAEHVVYDKWSCIRFIRALRKEFEENPCAENIFGYDIDRYPMEHDNKLYVEYIWDTIQDYALAYTIYTIQSSLLVTTFSVRVDSLFMDLGHFPLWDCDFFKRDSRLLEAYSRHSHILDYDMIRLGSQMLKNNPKRYAFGWGVYGLTEADKEFKNTQELEEVKAKDDECNQKNDLTHVLLKMARHACMIRGRNFIRIKADMQRVENITANLRQIGNVALITERGEEKPVLPWFAPYRIFAPFLMTLKGSLDNLYVNNRFLRSDNRLITSAAEKLRSIIGTWDERYMNVFGTRVLTIELQNGRMEGNVKTYKHYSMNKKIRPKRFASDCLGGMWEARGAANFVGLGDMAEFADYLATQDELLQENSHWQAELQKYQGIEVNTVRNDIKAVEKQLGSALDFLTQIENGKVEVSAETERALQTVVKNLCADVTEYVDYDVPDDMEETA